MKLLRAAAAAMVVTSAIAHAQAFTATAGSSSILRAQGATLSMYEGDRVTQFSAGYAQGQMQFGMLREARWRDKSIAVGDQRSTFNLAADLQDGGISTSVRGVRLARENQRSGYAFFTGKTGASFQSQFLQSQDAQHALAYLTWHHSITPRFTLSGVTVQREKHTTVLSAAQRIGSRSLFAISAGITEGSPVARIALDLHQPTWRVIATQSFGQWKMRREQRDEDERPMERSGLNISAQKELWHAVLLEGSQSKFRNPADNTQSTMHEAGVSFHQGKLLGAVRLLNSADGTLNASGRIAFAGWRARRWEVRATAMETESSTVEKQRSILFDSEQRITERLRISESVNFNRDTYNLAFGGRYESRLGSISLEHHTVYVPFGASAGLQRITSIGVRIHPFGNYGFAIDQVLGGGMRNAYTAVADTVFEGSLQGPEMHRVRMPKLAPFLLKGLVMDEDQKPIRGAAINVGDDTVFTDSEGRFEKRVVGVNEVRVALDPQQFLTAELYKAQTGVQYVKPGAQQLGENNLILRVRPCRGCDTTDPLSGNSALPQQPHAVQPRHALPSKEILERGWIDLIKREANLSR